MSFVDVNYRIVPFMKQTRSFFSLWPLIPSHPLPLSISSPLSFRFTYSFSYLSSQTSLEGARSEEETKNKRVLIRCAETKVIGTTAEFHDQTLSKVQRCQSSPIPAVVLATSSLNSDAFHYIFLCSMYSSRHATFVAQ